MADNARELLIHIKLLLEKSGGEEALQLAQRLDRAIEQLTETAKEQKEAVSDAAEANEELDDSYKVLTKDDVARALAQTGKGARDAAGDIGQMQKAATGANQVFEGMRRITGGGLINALVGASQVIRGLVATVTASLGPWGILLAILAAAGAAFFALRDALKSTDDSLQRTQDAAAGAAKQLEETKAATEAAEAAARKAAAEGLQKQAEAYEVLAQRAERALGAIRAIHRAEQGRDDAQLEVDLAGIDLQEKRGDITPEEAAKRRFDVQQQAARRRFEREQEERQREIAEERRKIATGEQQRGELDDQERGKGSVADAARRRAAGLDRAREEGEREREAFEAEAQRQEAEAEEALRKARGFPGGGLARGDAADAAAERARAAQQRLDEIRAENARRRAEFNSQLGDPALAAQIEREEREGRITPEEAARTRSGPRVRGSIGVAQDKAAGDLAAAEAALDEAAKVRAREVEAIDESIVASRERIQQLEREKALAEETFRLQRRAGRIDRAGEIFDEQKKAEEERRQKTFDTEGRNLGEQTRRGLGAIKGPTPEDDALIRAADRAARAMEDGVTAAEANATADALDRLADVMEKAGIATAAAVRRQEDRIRELERRMTIDRDTR